jgi:hypothetical protein
MLTIRSAYSYIALRASDFYPAIEPTNGKMRQIAMVKLLSLERAPVLGK